MECTAAMQQDGDWWIGWIAEVPGSIARSGRLRSCAAASQKRWPKRLS